MTVKELIAQLAAMPQDADVHLMVRDPKDAAFTDEVETTELVEGRVIVNGWVASDNIFAYAPWQRAA